MAGRSGILAAGIMLVDYVHRINLWPQQGWLAEVSHSEKAAGGAPLNVLVTLSRMQCQLPLAAIGLLGEDADGDYLMQVMDEAQIDRRAVQRSQTLATSTSQVMTAPDGQRTFFYAPGANRQLDIPHFDALNDRYRIFHLGYLLLLESLDHADETFGTRSARLLAMMQQRGYYTSLDLVSRAGDNRPLILPSLRWLDYLIINELEAEALTGITLRGSEGIQSPDAFAAAAQWLMEQGVRQRVIIHAPEGAWGREVNGAGVWQSSWQLSAEEIVGSVGAGDAFCAGVLYATHQGFDMLTTLRLAHTCACFNLHAANAIDGIRPLDEMQRWMDQAICVESRAVSGFTTSAEKT